MRGAPVKAIQELMGHADIQTTMRYMHLSPAALGEGIGLLESGKFGLTDGRQPQNAESPTG